MRIQTKKTGATIRAQLPVMTASGATATTDAAAAVARIMTIRMVIAAPASVMIVLEKLVMKPTGPVTRQPAGNVVSRINGAAHRPSAMDAQRNWRRAATAAASLQSVMAKP